MLNFFNNLLKKKKTYKLPYVASKLSHIRCKMLHEVDYILFHYFEITFISHLLLLFNIFKTINCNHYI